MASRRRGRQKPRYVWTGFNMFSFVQAGTRSETVLFDPAAYDDVLAAGLTCVRIRGVLSILADAGTAEGNIGGYIAAFPTDETETVVTGAPWDIDVQDIDIAEKRLLWLFHHRYAPFDEKPVKPHDVEIDVRVSVKVNPPWHAIFLVLNGTATHTAVVRGHCRALLRVG